MPDDVEALKAALTVARGGRRGACSTIRRPGGDRPSEAADRKLNRDRYGPRSERTARLLDQLELTLDELESAATEDELAAESQEHNHYCGIVHAQAASRQPFTDHLPREWVIVPGPGARSCCGGSRLTSLGEDMTETLEVIPKSWKVMARFVACEATGRMNTFIRYEKYH